MTSQFPAVIAVDGGNSKTDVALVAADGAILAVTRGPGMPGLLGDRTVEVIGDLITSAVERSGGPQPGGPVASCLYACVANADFPAEESQLTQMLAARGWAAQTVVANDTFAILRAGLDDVPAGGADRFWGVGITCGTGMNCAGIGPDGTVVRFLGLGPITGDWGGGGGLGMSALWHAARAADGRGPQTALRKAVPAHFGLAEPDDVAEALHFGTASWDRLADLAPVVFALAADGDEVADELVQRLAREVFLMARAAITRLNVTGQPVPVMLGGGIAAGAGPILTEQAAGLIIQEFPLAEVRVVREAPVAGAALLGLDHIQASLTAKRALRKEFAGRIPPPRASADRGRRQAGSDWEASAL